MFRTKRIKDVVINLAKEYISDDNYTNGFINEDWINRITKELNLKELTEIELTNMYDMVNLTLNDMIAHYRLNEDSKAAILWMDINSAFTEVVNVEARRRRYEN